MFIIMYMNIILSEIEQKLNIEDLLNSIKAAPNLNEANKSTIMRFYYEKLATGSMKKTTLNYKLKFIKRLAEALNKDFEEMTREDLIQFFNTLKPQPKTPKLNGTTLNIEIGEYSQYTVWLYKQVAKSFFKWLYEGNQTTPRDGHGAPLQVSWIRGSMNKIRPKFEKEVLTREEITKMIKTTNSLRDKAIISVLFETGLRASELLSMKRKDITFHEDYAEFKVDGKTGERMVMAVFSQPYLRQWIDFLESSKDYLNSNIKEFIWPAFGKVGKKKFNKVGYNELLNHFSLLSVITRAVKRAEISKHICTHSLRHSSATSFAKEGYTETEMRLKYGWTPTSNQVNRYNHQSWSDLKNRVLFKAGKNPEYEKQTQPLNLSKHCPFCSNENPFENEYCGKCAKPLNMNKIKEYEKANTAYAFTSQVIDNLTTLEKKGFDVQKFNDFMQQWVKQETKE